MLRKKYSKTFIPWLYMFVKAEHQVANTTLFQCARKYANMLFNIDLALAFGSLDRARYIVNVRRHLSREKADSLKDTYTTVVLNDSIPRILAHEVVRDTNKPLYHFCEGSVFKMFLMNTTRFANLGPLVSEAVVRTQRLLNEKRNHRFVQLVRIHYFTEQHPQFTANPSTSNNEIAAGKLPRDITVHTVELHCLLIHQKHACDCVMFSQIGWKCYHVLANMALLKEISIIDMMKSLPTRNSSGEQRKSLGPLHQGVDNPNRFTVNVFIKEISCETTSLECHARELNQCLLGKKISWGEAEGIFFWMVKFSNDAQLKMDCEELAQCINFAYTHGVNVAGVFPY
ncbi:Hypothetical protein PHPALM_3076 [Phytophthora palmivora]|uniref:SWIM-type domain-containing protein n=1 Tax=Phytophthora palmivora TaxID=4796 RepID=A0A2P4YNC3_9STRA|nr:Hypothetical protein PHPALM_3076 [Phytophthora palmivora]